MITRTDVLAHLQAGARTGFLKGSEEYTPLRSPFVREFPSDSAFEEYADMGNPPWPLLNEGKKGAAGTDGRTSKPQVNEMDEGRALTVVGGVERGLIVYNLGFEMTTSVSHSAINFDKAGDLEGWARSAGANYQKYLDYLCFDALNSGGATTNYGACYDGLSFFNDSHVDAGAEYTTTQDNNYALGLTLDNFETVMVAAAGFRGTRGQPVGSNHNILVVPPDLRREAHQITDNEWAYDTANRERNPYDGNISMIVAPGGWLDTTSWYLLDGSDPSVKPVGLQIVSAPDLEEWDDLKIGNGVRYFRFFFHAAAFYGDWRKAILGNT